MATTQLSTGRPWLLVGLSVLAVVAVGLFVCERAGLLNSARIEPPFFFVTGVVALVALTHLAVSQPARDSSERRRHQLALGCANLIALSLLWTSSWAPIRSNRGFLWTGFVVIYTVALSRVERNAG